MSDFGPLYCAHLQGREISVAIASHSSRASSVLLYLLLISDHGKSSTPKSTMGRVVHPNVIMGRVVHPNAIMGKVVHPPVPDRAASAGIPGLTNALLIILMIYINLYGGLTQIG